ncbi:hypothetical protein [Methylobacterium planeticum]|uniref:hypothetical protein n=1 Tax=Methylobacterium planeticum TaxID=2615211 RepID=UPI00178314B5|nr:hypothetical protein [Methylobacterium planeticum]
MLRLHLTASLALYASMHAGEACAASRPYPTNLTVVCAFDPVCVEQPGAGGLDRDVRPFEGSLGRPCAWRWRPTPSGTRKVRVCY